SAVKYDATDKSKITLQGKTGTTITNLKDGVADSDAVNVSQLKAVDTKLDTAKTELNTKIDTTKTDLTNKIDLTEHSLTNKVETTKSELTAQIDTTKTDLTNNLNTAKTELNTKIVTTETNLKNAGMNFAANSGDVAHRNLGETIGIIGGADATQASSNENVVTRTTDKGISVELLKDVKFDSVNVGANRFDQNGLFIFNGPSLTTAGVNAGGKRVTNVADAVESTDAVNKGQLDDVAAQQGALDNSAVKYDASDKSKITLQGKTGTTITNLKDGVADSDAVNVSQLKAVDTKLDTAKTDLNNKIEITEHGLSSKIDTTKSELVAQIDTTKTDLTNKIDSTEQGLTNKIDSTKSELTAKIDTTKTDLTNNINTAKNELNTKINTTETNLKNAGLNFVANNGDVAHRNLGETIEIVGGADATKASSNENVVTRTTDKGISVELLKDVKFDSVNVGENTTLNNTGLIIKDGPSITTAGINAGGKRVTNVANGVEATDAVNKGQLDDVVAQQGTLDNSAVKYDASDKSKITLQGKTGTTITNLKDGVADTDAVNMRQLGKLDDKFETAKTELNSKIDTTKTDLTNNLNTAKTELNTKIVTTETNLKNAGLNFVANSGDVAHRNLGETIEIVGGADATKASSNENVVTRTTDKGISVELLKDVKFDSVNVGGNTTLNNNGLILKDGPSITTAGINAGGKGVTNVAKGTISKDSTDAVNGSQIHAISTSIKNSIGGETTINADGTITTHNIGGTGQNTLDGAIGSVNAKLDDGINSIQNTGMNFGANSGKTVHRKLGQTLNIVGGSDADEDATSGENIVTRATDDGIRIEMLKDVKFDSVNVGGNIFNQNGLFILNGPSITTAGVNAGGKRVTNVADAVESTDAVNKGQLDKLKDEVAQEIGKIPNNVVQYDKDGKDTVTLQGDKGTTIKNVADGAIKEGSKDAVNGGQLWNVQNQVDKNTSDINNLQNNIENITNGKSGLVQQEKPNSNITVGKDTGGKSVNMSGKDGDRTIQGVKGGEISATSNQAVNGSQIHKINDSIKNAIGGETKLNNDGTLSVNNIGGTGKNTIDGAINHINQNQQELSNKVNTLQDRLEQGFYDVNNRMDSLNKDLSAGIAAAMAIGNLPQPTEAGKNMISAGVSGYNGEGAVSFGLSTITEDNKYVIKVGGTADTRSNVSGSVSVGFQW
ncbi:YadA-like family protein, partial [Acinetobacter baumannii]|uniref:YadA-like family protein n=1 Tax=Acinetobacter baumannii TaxID=470 RepID=UPI000AA76566